MLLCFMPIRYLRKNYHFLVNANFKNVLQKASCLVSTSLNLENHECNLAMIMIASKLYGAQNKFTRTNFLSNLALTLEICKKHFTSCEIINNASMLCYSPIKLKIAIEFYEIFGIKIRPYHLLFSDSYMKLNLKYLCENESFDVQYLTRFYDSITLKANVSRINFDDAKITLLDAIIKILTSLNQKQHVYVSDAFEEALRQQVKLQPKNIYDFLNKFNDYTKCRAHLYFMFFPKIIKKLSYKNTEFLLNFLINDLKMNDEQIILAQNIMVTSFPEILRRLIVLVKNHGKKMLMHRDCLSIISAFQFLPVKERLDKLKSTGFDLTSKFKIKHINDFERASIVIVIRLSVHKDREKLHIDDKTLKEKIMNIYSRHPQAKNFSHFNALEVLDYLIINENVNIYQIINSPYVVLHSKSSIENAINEAKKHDDYFEFEKSPNFLEFILYIINKKENINKI